MDASGIEALFQMIDALDQGRDRSRRCPLEESPDGAVRHHRLATRIGRQRFFPPSPPRWSGAWKSSLQPEGAPRDVDPAQEQASASSATQDAAHTASTCPPARIKPSKLLMPVLTGLGLWLVVEQLLGLGEIRGVLDEVTWAWMLVVLVVTRPRPSPKRLR